MQLAGAEAGKPACMALLSAFEAGRQPRLAMQVSSSLHKGLRNTSSCFKAAASLCMGLVPAKSCHLLLTQIV